MFVEIFYIVSNIYFLIIYFAHEMNSLINWNFDMLLQGTTCNFFGDCPVLL